MRRYRHLKRGTSYTLLGRAELQSSTALSEGAVLAIYYDRNCERLWARPVGEFYDGRFVEESGEFGLVYKSRHYDDWGTIRFANGDLFGTVRLKLDDEDLARHRRENTDPYENAARRLIESYYVDNFPKLEPATATPLSPTDAALAAIAAERRRQIDREGWSVEHDDIHTEGELAMAAASYALAAALPEEDRGSIRTPGTWPWDETWWKPTYRVRDLVKAAALLIAEIERLERASSRVAA